MNTAAVAAFARLGELNDYPALLAAGRRVITVASGAGRPG